MNETYTLVLAKEDFKFSSAHFTLFARDVAELLHGHNYQVRLEIVGCRLDEYGLIVDFAEIKGAIRELCARLDSRTLIPAHSPFLEIEESGGQVHVGFQDRRYSFPAADVEMLPLVNTSIELLARYIWERFAPELERHDVVELGVEVSETAGQGCWFRASLPERES